MRFSQNDRARIALDERVGAFALDARLVCVPHRAKCLTLGAIVDLVENRQRRAPRAQP